MKKYLSLLTAALVLAACGQEAPKPAEPAAASPVAESMPATESASAASAAAEAPVAVDVPDECKVTISGNDQMKFDTEELSFKSTCKEVALTVKHAGSQPKASMGHNVVIAKAADKDAIAADGTAAGADSDYLKAGDERVVAATKMVGGGEESTVVFPVSKLAKGEEYVFFCTFPAHSNLMKGVVKLVD